MFGSRELVFPTSVGMNRRLCAGCGPACGVPHERGDEPGARLPGSALVTSPGQPIDAQSARASITSSYG